MTHFHAVMLDECGSEFGAGINANSKDEARDMLREMYPENRGIVQLESPEDTRKRESLMYARINWEMSNPGCEGQWYPGIEDDEDEYYD